jgi:gamma-glutamylcyclotransferase (GGCT)/AIG2-like uncharacterized protein YtfP
LKALWYNYKIKIKGEEKMYYFTYGSNMNHAQMKKRCPNSEFIKPVFIKNYYLVFDGYSSFWSSSTANIIPSFASMVYGGLYELDEFELKILDIYEGCPDFYERELVEAYDDNKNTYDAWVYLRREKKHSKPSLKYMKTMLEGAIDCKLPKEYFKWLKMR